jgi:hypothetical protein
VTVSGLTLLGADVAKYALTQPTTNADITAATVTPSVAVPGKVYDGGTAATITGRSLSGVIGNDDVNLGLSGTASFADKNVGTSKLVTVSGLSISGPDAANYKLVSDAARATADILARAITVTAVADSKVYDGNTTATLYTAGVTLVDVVPGDVVTVNTAGATGAFTNPDVGRGKTVWVSGLTLSGTDAGDYTLAQPTTTADITQASSITALVSPANPSLQGSIVTFTATVGPVTPPSADPTGNVQFYTNGVALGSPVALTDGEASFSTADLPAGTNTVLAAYLGDSNFLGCSNSLAQAVSVVPGTPSAIGIQNSADGTVTMTFAGTPGALYVVQASDNLAPPAWENVSTNTAGTDGHWTLTESTEPHPVRFYRSARP